MKLTIFQRLTAGYLSIMLMVFLFGGYTAYQLNRLTRITHRAAGADSDVIDIAGDLSTRLHILLALEKKYWISRDEDFYHLFQKRQDEFRDQLKGMAGLMWDEEPKILLARALDTSQSYFDWVETLRKKGDEGPSDAYESERDDMIRTLATLLDQIRLSGNTARHEKIKQSETISARVLWVSMMLAAASIVLGIAVSLLTTRQIVYPILQLRNKTRDIASGRFVAIRNMKAPPEIHDLANDFNTMSERLNELDTLKEDFVSHISHALRTPLTSIWEASSMLIRGTFDNDPASRQQLLTIVSEECKRLIDSVNRILDLSRMEAGMMDYQFTHVDLADLIRSIVFKLSPIAKSRQIRMAFDTEQAIPRVSADTDAMTQLFEDLIGNALKFTPPGGSVTVEAAVADDSRGRVLVSVSDTGCGIENEHLEHIFEKFHRIEKGKQTTRGTGLGLAIVKHIVAAHGGVIWVKSEKDKGSTFYLSLPCA